MHLSYEGTCARWLAQASAGEPHEIAKATDVTRAWFARIGDRDVFAKWYPPHLQDTWAKVEIALAGAHLHPCIVPLRQIVHGADGLLFIYDRVAGDNLGPSDARGRFSRLPLAERIRAVLAVSDALAAICDAGYMVVDWYFGNMIYDWGASTIWLFDWELCRPNGAFTLEMDSNYGSSSFMAPEEFVRGSRLDPVTLVFNLGRFALLTLPELAEPLAPVFARATYPARSGRFATVRMWSQAFRDATGEAWLNGKTNSPLHRPRSTTSTEAA